MEGYSRREKAGGKTFKKKVMQKRLMKLMKWTGLYDLYLIFNADPELLEKRNKELEIINEEEVIT